MDFIRFAFIALYLLSGVTARSQQPAEADIIRKVFNDALTSYEAYHNLGWLCKNTAGRICGTGVRRKWQGSYLKNSAPLMYLPVL